MKKIICMLVCTFAVFTFCGCDNGTSGYTKNSDVKENESFGYDEKIDTGGISFTSAYYTNGGVSIAYPQIKDENSDLNKQINFEILQEAKKAEYYFDGIDNVELEVEYRTGLFDNQILSIVYLGSAFSDEVPRAMNLIYTTNIDLKTGERIVLSDILNVDNELVAIIKSDQAVIEDEQNKKQVRDIDDEELLAMLKLADKSDGITINNLPKAYSYYNKNIISVVLFNNKFDVDYIDVDISADSVLGLLKYQN